MLFFGTRATIHEVAPLLTEAIGGLFRIFPEFWADAGNRENIVSGVFVIVSVVAGIIVTKVVGTATLAALATAAAVDALVGGVEALAIYAVTNDGDKAMTTFYWGVAGGLVGNLWGAISLLRAGKKAGLIFKNLAGLPKQLDLETFASRARSILNDEAQYQRLLDDLNLPENEALRLAMLQDADGALIRAWGVIADFSDERIDVMVLTRLSIDLLENEGLELFLKNNTSKIDEWIEFDAFFSSPTEAYWSMFNSPPSDLGATRVRAIRALQEYPDEYTGALEIFGLLKSDLFTRHGVDYGEEFFQIITNFKSTDPHNLTDSEIYAIFGYTTNFFTGI